MMVDKKPSSLARWRRRWPRLFDHLKFPAKLMVVGLLLAAPLLMASTWAALSAMGHARDAQSRQDSIALMRQISALLGTVGEHRGLSTRILAGTEGLGGELLLTQQQLRAQASQLDQALQRAGPALDPAAETPLRSEADALIQLPHAKEPERNFERHNDLADRLLAVGARLEIRMLAGLSAEDSALGHTYSAVFLGLPQVAERLARQRGYGSWVLTQQTYTPQELHRYGLFAGHAQQSLRQLMADKHTLAELDAGLKPRSPAPSGPGDPQPSGLSSALELVLAFSEGSQRVVLAFTRDDAVAEQHFSEGSAALKTLTAASAALADRLTERAATQRDQASRYTTWALAGLVLSVSLVTALYVSFARSTVHRLHQLQRASQRLADGAFNRRIRVHGSDEIAQLAEAMDALRGRLREALHLQAELISRRQVEQERATFMAHWGRELQTPLNHILGDARLLQAALDGPRAPAAAGPLRRLEQTARQLLHLMDAVATAHAARTVVGAAAGGPSAQGLTAANDAGLVSDLEHATSAGQIATPHGERSATRLLRGHVALIEDNEVNAQLFAATLALQPALGLTHFTHIEQALAAAVDLPIDLWVIDRHIGGDDALARLPALQQRFGPIRAVLYTSDASPETRSAALQAGFLDHWTKPMSPSVLMRELQRWLQPALPDSPSYKVPG